MDAAPFRTGRALLGFMSEPEALEFLRGTCVFEDDADLRNQQGKWASASKAARELRRPPPVPGKKPIAQEFGSYLEKVAEQPAFKQTCGGKCALQRIEIENLIAFQRNIDTEYASELASKMKASEQFVMESCLPLSFQQNLDVTFDPTAPGGVSFSSFSPKLVFSGVHITGVGGPQVKIGEQVVQQPGALFLIGTQANYVQVAELNSRFFLKNGYHRAYAALLAGLKHLPAVLSNITDFAETGAQRPGFFPKERLMSETPPLLKDFLDDRLAVDLKFRAMRRVIRIRMDDFFVPR
jgi:hypothetical protein